MPEAAVDGMIRTLALCIGNPLRGDDDAGHAVGRRLERVGIPGLHVVHAFQLMPEHAEDIAGADRCIIIDATIEPVAQTRLSAWSPGAHGSSGTHGIGIDELVGMARQLYGADPQVLICAIPAANLEHGAGLSTPARRGVNTAIHLLRELLSTPASR